MIILNQKIKEFCQNKKYLFHNSIKDILYNEIYKIKPSTIYLLFNNNFNIKNIKLKMKNYFDNPLFLNFLIYFGQNLLTIILL